MSVFRNLLLWGSENSYMKNRVPQYKFVQRAVKRFMPGETANEAVDVASEYLCEGIPTIFTYLGENIADLSEADDVTKHYLDLLENINKNNIQTEISIKLTHIGFDYSYEQTFQNMIMLCEKAKEYNNVVWIDMESTSYTQSTIDFYKSVKEKYSNIGLCIQAYLYRTKEDIEELLKIEPYIRLVKGAYNEPKDLAMESKADVDVNYYELAKILLDGTKNNNGRVAFATHDDNVISKIVDYGNSISVDKNNVEFQMLYGIKSGEQRRLAKAGYKILVLISYGDAWFPWYMRRLAERPANVGFVIKNMFSS